MNYKNTLAFKAFKRSKYLSLKYKNYFHIYDLILKKFINKKILFVEIGVFSGGSLFMWKNFFGKKAKIIGIDLNPEIKNLKYGFEIEIGDQSDENFWKNFLKSMVKSMLFWMEVTQIFNNEQSMIPYINDGGLLITEDNTSYIR